MMNPKVFVFGIDSVDSDLLLDLARSGRMPVLRSLLGRAVWAYTDNNPPISESYWPNVFTGVNPARHGRYFHSQIVPGSYRTRLFYPRDVKAPPYWSHLSDAGRRVIVVDVPKTWIAGPVNGLHIVDWATHDQEISEGFATWPPELASQLDRRFGRDPIGANDFGGNGPRDMAIYRDASIANVERKTRLAEALIAEEEWDHCLIVYDDGHHVGHYTWHLHDPDHPGFRPVQRERIGDPLEDVCVALDEAMGRIVGALEPNCGFALLVGAGIGPNYHASYLLDGVLRRLEGRKMGRGRSMNPLRALWRKVPLSWQRSLTPAQNALRNTLLESDRRKRKAFHLPAADDTGSIRINLAGREPNGLVQPGAEFERMCASLEEGLLRLRNVETGGPVVENVFRVAEHCSGPYLDHLPDLVVNWSRASPIRAIQSPEIGTLQMPQKNNRTGIHNTRGLFLATTDRAGEERLPRDIHVMDVAPTLCSWMGVDLDGADGRVVAALKPGASIKVTA